MSFAKISWTNQQIHLNWTTIALKEPVGLSSISELAIDATSSLKKKACISLKSGTHSQSFVQAFHTSAKPHSYFKTICCVWGVFLANILAGKKDWLKSQFQHKHWLFWLSEYYSHHFSRFHNLFHLKWSWCIQFSLF